MRLNASVEKFKTVEIFENGMVKKVNCNTKVKKEKITDRNHEVKFLSRGSYQKELGVLVKTNKFVIVMQRQRDASTPY